MFNSLITSWSQPCRRFRRKTAYENWHSTSDSLHYSSKGGAVVFCSNEFTKGRVQKQTVSDVAIATCKMTASIPGIHRGIFQFLGIPAGAASPLPFDVTFRDRSTREAVQQKLSCERVLLKAGCAGSQTAQTSPSVTAYEVGVFFFFFSFSFIGHISTLQCTVFIS